VIDKTLNKYRDWMPDLDSNNHWAMAALELAYSAISMKGKNDTKPYTEKLEELTKELEAYISRK
jgi:cell division protein ZapA